MSAAKKWTGRFAVGVVTSLLAGLLIAQPAAAALPDLPQGLAPTTGSYESNPILSWEPVPGATSYKVELSRSPLFSPLLSGAGTSKTVNFRWTPPVGLPTGEVYWRVAAVNSSGSSDWAIGQFSRSAAESPVLKEPVDGAEIHSPTEHITFRWDGIPGAVGYEIQVDDDPDFANAPAPTSVTRQAYTLPTLPPAGTWHWRVRAKLPNNVVGEWQLDPFSYTVLLFDVGISLEPTLPADNASDAVEDVVLDWKPIPGAVRYDLQVALDDQFLTMAHSRDGVVGSRYSPPGVLANDQYWWRIRPVDADGHKAEWNNMPVWRFQRHWPDQARLQYPANRAVLTNPDQVFFQWAGVHLASSYTVELATNPDFAGTVGKDVQRCTTVNTTFTPSWENTNALKCVPTVGTTYWWRVRSTDSPASGSNAPETDPLAPQADVFSFTYAPTVVEQKSPRQGETVAVPTLRWSPVSGAATYKVQVTSLTDGKVAVNNVSTTGTSFTPRDLLTGGYRWQVQAFSAKGTAISNPLLTSSQPTFNVVDEGGSTASRPDPVGSPMDATPRFPTLNWKPVADATSYKLRVKRAENPTWSLINASFSYPAGEDTGTAFLNAGTYDWQVDAYAGSALLSTGSIGKFTVAPPRTVVGHQAALVGTDLDTGDDTRRCTASLPHTCQNLRQTPVLSWDADPDAARYELILSDDPVLTDSIDRRIKVYGTSWIDVATLDDANAASGTYWGVISCPTVDICPIKGSAQHVFNKQSPRVTLQSPADGAKDLSDEVVLTWRDWLAEPHLEANTPLTATAPTTEARYYQVQTSTSPDFSRGVIDNAVAVDQTTFTSFTNVYPDGPVYWRVRAFDGSNKPSAWSLTRSFTVKSPAPATAFPATGQRLLAESAFEWEPLPLAASYELRILKNDGSSIDSASPVFTKTGIQQASYALPTQLPVIAAGADGNNYRWFLRRKSVSGGNGPWNEPGVAFKVSGQAPAQLAPTVGAVVEPRAGLFTWSEVPGAATYRVEDRLVGGSTTTSPSTVAPSYAPTAALALGKREWRVTAYNAQNDALGTSAWRSYSVPGITGSVEVSGEARPGSTLTAQVAWQPSGVQTAYQWLSAGRAITGATGRTYSVKSDDLGKALSVKVTGTMPGYDAKTLTSGSVTIAYGPAPQITASPTITGTAKIGYTLTVSTGSWSPTATSYRYQWLRNGVAITGATKRTYVVTAADPGRNLRVRVTALRTGSNNGSALSTVRAIPKVATTTTARFVDATIRRSVYPKMTVSVKAPGISGPTGYIRFYEGTRLLKTVNMGAAKLGRVTVTLPKRSLGYHYIVAKYAGSTKTKASNSKRVLLHVRR